MGWLCCMGSPPRKPRKPGRRLSKKKVYYLQNALAASARASGPTNSFSGTRTGSHVSDDDWESACEHFSDSESAPSTPGHHTPSFSLFGGSSLFGRGSNTVDDVPEVASPTHGRSRLSVHSDGGYEDASSGMEAAPQAGGDGLLGRLAGCLSVLDRSSPPPASPRLSPRLRGASLDLTTASSGGAAGTPGRRKSASLVRGPAYRPPAGCTMRRLLAGEAIRDSIVDCYHEMEGTSFNVRSIDYMKTKVKVRSGPSWYRLAAVDMFSFEGKRFHIAQHVTLPCAPKPGGAAGVLPPLLIINLQLPSYQVRLPIACVCRVYRLTCHCLAHGCIAALCTVY